MRVRHSLRACDSRPQRSHNTACQYWNPSSLGIFGDCWSGALLCLPAATPPAEGSASVGRGASSSLERLGLPFQASSLLALEPVVYTDPRPHAHQAGTRPPTHKDCRLLDGYVLGRNTVLCCAVSMPIFCPLWAIQSLLAPTLFGSETRICSPPETVDEFGMQVSLPTMQWG